MNVALEAKKWITALSYTEALSRFMGKPPALPRASLLSGFNQKNSVKIDWETLGLETFVICET